jgi:hypothetical protein
VGSLIGLQTTWGPEAIGYVAILLIALLVTPLPCIPVAPIAADLTEDMLDDAPQEDDLTERSDAVFGGWNQVTEVVQQLHGGHHEAMRHRSVSE